jgi:hypothetical protein
MKNPKRNYFLILILGVVLWITETAAFGFNTKPESGLEAFLDLLAGGMIFYGLIGDLLQNVEIHKNYYKYKETNIKTRSVNISGYRKATETGEARPISVAKELTDEKSTNN